MRSQHVDKRFDRIWQEVGPYVEHMCARFSSSFRYRIAEDLRQECAIKLVELLRRTSIPDAELTALFRTSIHNLLCDFYRAYSRTFGLEDDGLKDEWGEEILESREPSPFDVLVLKEYADMISMALEFDIDRRVLELLLAPPRPLVTRAERVFYDTKLRGTSAQAAGHANAVEITGSMIAQSLGTSPATVSRSISRLRRIVSKLIHGPKGPL